MDKPNRIAVAVIGDGESETGPTASVHRFTPSLLSRFDDERALTDFYYFFR